MNSKRWAHPLQLPPGFTIRRQLDLWGQWEWAASHFGWSTKWYRAEKQAVRRARARERYLYARDRQGDVYP